MTTDYPQFHPTTPALQRRLRRNRTDNWVGGVLSGVGSTYNIIGHWAKALFTAVQKKDLDTARTIQGNMNNVIDMLLSAGIYPTLKEVLALQGVPCGSCRAPMSKASDAQKAAAAEIAAFISRVDGK